MRVTTRFSLGMAFVATIATVAASAPAHAEPSRPNVDGTLTIGSLGPETGDLSPVLNSLRVPVQLAVDEINAAGGVNDAPVALVNGDDGSDVTVATRSLQRMMNRDRVDAVIGPGLSTTAVGILDVIEAKKVLVCAGSNTMPTLSQKGIAGGYYFRTSPPDKLQPTATAKLLHRSEVQRVAIVFIDDSYGQRYAAALSKLLEEAQIKVVADVGFDPEGTTFESDAKKVARSKPDAIALIAFPGVGAKVIQSLIAADIGPSDVPLFTNDGLDSADLPTFVDPNNLGALAGTQGTTPASATSGIAHPFFDAFAATGFDLVFSAYYYDCTIIVALAAESAGSDDPARIRKHITKVLKGKTHCSTFADCKAALDRDETINYDGAASDYAQFSDHEPLVGTYDVFTFDASGTKTTLGTDAQVRVP